MLWNTSNHYLKFGTSNTERMKIAVNGYVAIGASNPVNMIHIHNPSTTVDNILQMTNGITGSNVTNGLQINMDISRNVSLWSIENGYMRFATNNTERMRINSSGNVGINTGGTISAMLHVNGGTIYVNNNLAAVPTTGIVGGTGDRLVLWQGTGSAHPYSFGIDTSTLWSSVPAGGQYRWYVGGVQQMQLTTSGAMSISTTAPPSGHIMYAMSNAATGLTSKIENQNATSTAFTAISVTNNTTNSCSLFLNSSTRTSDGAANVATLRNDAGDLRLAATGTNPYMFLQSSTGRAGINTITPTSTLQVNGDLDVTTNFKTGNVQRMDNLGNMTNILSINIIPPGTILMFGGAAAPAGWLLCNGSAVSRTTYSLLFTAIGTTYGAGDGSTTFTLPDLRGRVAVGSGTGPSLTARTVGNSGGAETHTLSTPEIPSHTHAATTNAAGGHSHAGSSIAANGSHTHTGTTAAAGNHSHGGITGGMNQNWNHAHQTANGAPDDLNYSGTWAAQYPLADGPGAYFNGTITGYTDTNHTHNIGADGSHTHTFTTASAGSHTHTLTVTTDGSHTHTYTTNATGGGGAHNNMQPFLVVAYMIKT
jgi:microcystin-dependent protein